METKTVSIREIFSEPDSIGFSEVLMDAGRFKKGDRIELSLEALSDYGNNVTLIGFIDENGIFQSNMKIG